ncbi:MAG: hypothetical protein SNJ77_03675 [Cytophagales bacterium]
MRNIVVIVGISLLIATSCKPKEKAPDPCASQKPVSAGFKIQESRMGILISEDYDTVRGGALFVADIDDAKYTWLIGDGVYHEKSQYISFGGSVPSDEAVPVTLIVEKEPNLSCFPTDNGKDTLTRLVWNNYDHSFINTPIKGYLINEPNKEIEIRIVQGYFSRMEAEKDWFLIVGLRYPKDTIIIQSGPTGGGSVGGYNRIIFEGECDVRYYNEIVAGINEDREICPKGEIRRKGRQIEIDLMERKKAIIGNRLTAVDVRLHQFKGTY